MGLIRALLWLFFRKPKKKRPKTNPYPLDLPFAIMMISYIMWGMPFIGETIRRERRTFSDYSNQFLGNILSYFMPAKDPPGIIRYRTLKDHSKNILLLSGLMTVSSKAVSVPNIYLSGERILNMKLRKSRGKYGKLNICKLSYFELYQVIYVLWSLPSDLLNKVDTNPIILDTGFSISYTGFRFDFVDGTLFQVCHPHLMD